MKLTARESNFIGICIEGFLYGLYSGIFVMYFQDQTSKKGTEIRKNILFYALCALYILCVVAIALDITLFIDPFQSLTAFLHIAFL